MVTPAVSRALLLVAAAALGAAQEKPRPSGLTEHVNVDLVQLNFLATDRKGRPVSDLRANEVEISEGGVPQAVALLQRYYLPKSASGEPGSAVPPPEPLAPAPARSVTPGRWIALVVDNYATTTPTAIRAIEALRKFLETGLAPGDQVALIHFAGKIDVLQGFTTDKERLERACDTAVSVTNRAVEDRFGSLDGLISDMTSCRGRSNSLGCVEKYAAAYQDARFREADALMTALTTIVRSLAPIPDIKTLVLFSEGFSRDPAGDAQDAARVSLGARAPQLVIAGSGTEELDAEYEKLSEAAASAKVSIFTVNPGGAAKNSLVSARRGGFIDEASGALQIDPFRRSEQNRQAGLADLAHRTGGTATQGTDAFRDLQGVVNLSAGLYTVAYYPRGDIPISRLRDVRIRVLRKGVRVEGRRELPRPESYPPLTGELTLAHDPCSDRGRRAVVMKLRLDRSRLLFEDLEGKRSANFSVFIRLLVGDAAEPAFQDYRFLNITNTAKEFDSHAEPDPVIEETLTLPCKAVTVAITASDAGSGARGEFTAALLP